MPLIRIFRCAPCDTTQTISADRDGWAPLCPSCRGPMKWKQTRDYRPEQHGFDTGMRSAALDYNQTSGRIAPIGAAGVPINSLADIRRIERESEQAERNGEGERMIFRKYSQDAGNLYTHTMGEAPRQGPSPEWLRRNGHRIGSVAGEPVEEMAPETREDLASALPMRPVGAD